MHNIFVIPQGEKESIFNIDGDSVFTIKLPIEHALVLASDISNFIWIASPIMLRNRVELKLIDNSKIQIHVFDKEGSLVIGSATFRIDEYKEGKRKCVDRQLLANRVPSGYSLSIDSNSFEVNCTDDAAMKGVLKSIEMLLAIFDPSKKNYLSHKFEIEGSRLWFIIHNKEWIEQKVRVSFPFTPYQIEEYQRVVLISKDKLDDKGGSLMNLIEGKVYQNEEEFDSDVKSVGIDHLSAYDFDFLSLAEFAKLSRSEDLDKYWFARISAKVEDMLSDFYCIMPTAIKELIDKYGQDLEDNPFKVMEEFTDEVKELGYFIDYGLSGEAYGLQSL